MDLINLLIAGFMAVFSVGTYFTSPSVAFDSWRRRRRNRELFKKHLSAKEHEKYFPTKNSATERSLEELKELGFILLEPELKRFKRVLLGVVAFTIAFALFTLVDLQSASSSLSVHTEISATTLPAVENFDLFRQAVVLLATDIRPGLEGIDVLGLMVLCIAIASLGIYVNFSGEFKEIVTVARCIDELDNQLSQRFSADLMGIYANQVKRTMKETLGKDFNPERDVEDLTDLLIDLRENANANCSATEAESS